MQPGNAPPVVNNADGSVSMQLCFPVKTAKKADQVEFSLEYTAASGYHLEIVSVKVFGPIATREGTKDQAAVLGLIASYEGVKTATAASALLSDALADPASVAVAEAPWSGSQIKTPT